MTAAPYRLAAFLCAGEPQRLYAALSVLVSTVADGARCAALASFGALELLLDEDLLRRAQEPEATPALSWAGREAFARSLIELRDTAGALGELRLYACSASVETMNLTAEEVGRRLDGVMSTPRFLREADGAPVFFA